MAGFEDFELTAPQPPVPSGPVPQPKPPSFRERKAAGQVSSSLTPERLAEDHAEDLDPGNIDQLEQAIARTKEPKARSILVDEHNRIKGRVDEELAAKASFDDFHAASAPVTSNTNAMRWAAKRREGKPDVTDAALNIIPLADLILGLPTFIAQVGATGVADLYYGLQGEGKPLEAANKKMEEVMATPWMKFLASPVGTLLPADTSNTTVHEALGGIEGAIKSASEYWAEKTGSTEIGEGLKQATQIAMLEGGRTFVKGFKEWQAKKMADPELNLGEEPIRETKARRPGSADPGVEEGVIVSETKRGNGERLPAPKSEAGSIFDVEKDVAKFSEADLKATGLTRDELRRTLNEAAMPDRMKFLAATAGAGAAGLAGQALWNWAQSVKNAPREEGEPQPSEDGNLLAKKSLPWLVGGAALAGVVKMKGGMWHPEAVERLADPIAKKLSEHVDRTQFDINDKASLSSYLKAVEPYEKWADDKVRNYLNKYAGTEGDPLKNVEIPFGEGTKRWEDLTDATVERQPASYYQGFEEGKGLEKVPANEMISNIGRGRADMVAEYKALQGYLSHVGDYLRQNVKPENLERYDLVRAVKETAENDARVAKQMEKAAAGSMKDLPVYKAYPDGFKWVELKLPDTLTPEQAKQVRPATKADNEGATGDQVYKYVAVDASGKAIKNTYTSDIAGGDTPQKAFLAGQLAHEGNNMGHCVGGYCEGVASGESKIYSLRDPKGKSHVTVEVTPPDVRLADNGPQAFMKAARPDVYKAWEKEPREKRDAFDRNVQQSQAYAEWVRTRPHDVVQIKGKQNRAPSKEYLPYVQDFVKGGKWGEVGDLEGTGLEDLHQFKSLTDNFRKSGDPRFEELHSKRYLNKEEFDYVSSGGRAKGFEKTDRRTGSRDLSDAAMLRRTDALHRESGRRLSEVSPEQLAAYRRGELHEGEPAWRTIKEAEALGQPNDWRARQRGVLPNEGGNITVETAAKLAALGIGAAAGAYLAPDSKFFGAAVGAAAVLAAMALRRPDSAIRREVSDSLEAARREFHPAFYLDAAKRKGAKLGEAVIASNISKKMQSDSAIYHASEASRRYWDKVGVKEQVAFIRGFERGWTSKDPVLRAMAERYRAWNADIYAREQKLGIEYEARDHYLYHTFENPEGVAAFLAKHYGAKWGDPKFSKERGFDYYDEAIKAGFKPKTLNPEQIMLNRQYASNVAEMRINILRDLREQGLARTKSEAHLNTSQEMPRRAPNGQMYYVDPRADQILHNAFDTESLWNRRDAIGTVFRGGMAAKNTLVPIILNLSLFHPLHLILGMDNSAAMLRSIKKFSAGTITSGQHASAMIRAGNPITAIYDSVWTNPKAGWRPFQLWKGKVPAEKVTAADREILTRTFEGGFIPEMAQEWKTHAIENFKKSMDSGDVAAIPKFLLAMPQYLQKPLFEYWIPQLKYSSYLKDTEAALQTNPKLLTDQDARMVAFRKIAKSVENRYGEMAYSTLFWPRILRDVGVLNALSLGWSLGFFREYGGGLREAGHGVINLDKRGKIAKGEMDRFLFVSLYTANTALYGGIATWMLTGQPPTEWLDYFYPKTGDKKKDGSPERVNTMFYSREWLGMFKHMQNEGMLSGASQFMLNKLAPTWGISKGLWTNLDYFGKEISDPNSSAFKQLVQKVAWAAGEVTPIPIQSMKKQGDLTPKKVLLNVAGFSPAPKYATETPLEGKIASMYRHYHSGITPYARAQRGDETRELYGMKQQGDDAGFDAKLEEMREKYKLSHGDVVRIRKSAAVPPTERMFRNLSSEQQVRLLGSMSADEKERFRPYLKKEVRRSSAHDD